MPAHRQSGGGDGVKICFFQRFSNNFKIVQNGVCGCSPSNFFEPISILSQTSILRSRESRDPGIWGSRNPGIQGSRDPGIRPWGGPWGRCQYLSFSTFFEKFQNRPKRCLRLQPQPLFRAEFVFVSNLIFKALPGHPLYGPQDSYRSPGIQGPQSVGGVRRKNPWGRFPGLSF